MKRGKIVVSALTVHTIVDGNEPNIIAGKDDFRIAADLQIIPPQTAHILDDPGADQALLHQRKPFLDTGTIEVRPGVPVIDQHTSVREAPFAAKRVRVLL